MIKDHKLQPAAVQEALTVEEPVMWRSLAEHEGGTDFPAELDYEYTPTQEELK